VKIILSIIHNKWVTLAFRIILGALFIFGASVKLPNIKMYSVNVVYEYGILPVGLAKVFGYLLPFLELAAGLAILFGVLTRLASVCGGLLGMSFAIGEGIVLSQGRNIDCGCFGGLIDTMMSATIYLSIVMMVFGLLICTSPNRNFVSITSLIFKKLKTIPKILKVLS
jgi:uncharacterized membrane protein YphA (DoxX/SURF4 family)